MRIVHIVEPFASGIATFVRSLVEGLSHDTHVVVHGERAQVMRSDQVKMDFPSHNVHFIRWEFAQRAISPSRDFHAFLELFRILKTLKSSGPIDAVHLHSSKSGFLGRLACRAAGIRQVIYTPNGAPFLAGSPAARLLFRQLERIAASLGGSVVCCSPSECVAYHSIGIKATCINNGVSVPHSMKMAGPPMANFRVVTCGRVIAQKNPLLFNQIAKYFETLEDIEFVWIGNGPDRHTLTARNITVTGWMSMRATQRLLASASVYISTSNFEGMPFAVLEALVQRKPVLLKDCVGNRDIVVKGANGDLFTSTENAIFKILRYYNNREMLAIMGEFSHTHCEREFNVSNMSTAYRQLYACEPVK